MSGGMRRWLWQITFVAALLASSLAVYFVQFLLFRKPLDQWFYFFQDFAFVPISVLVVTLILNRALAMHEKQRSRRKVHMLIGAFFADIGRELLGKLAHTDQDRAALARELTIAANWTEREYQRAAAAFRKRECRIGAETEQMEDLKEFLGGQRRGLMTLLESPSLLEHESFSELLWAVSHLADELACRPRLAGLSENDRRHLAADIQRAYRALVAEWLLHLMHLRRQYPYLYSLALRTNPFDPNAKVELA